ncbi:E3 ubiquitin-protein ligase SHPRH [Echinococcus granulosus]|nr:E3 ubiquitin-protein ligase SHPRH [Echinococcus granulosus]
MRRKSLPRFLSKRAQAARFFVHIRVPSPPSSVEPKQPRKRSKNLPDVKFDLSRTYDHSVAIQMCAEIPSNSICLQSLSLPFSSSLLSYFSQSRRADIYFSSSPRMALCFEAPESRERVVLNADFPNLSFILFGLSSTSLSLYGRVVAQSLEVDVIVRSSAIFTTSNFIQYAISSQQFEKIFSFITLQIWPQDGTLDELRLPLFSDLSETQEEFIASLDSVYTAVQHTHLVESSWWNDPNICQPKEIKIDLLPYQVDAIRWMIFREKNCLPVVDPKWLSPYFVRINEDNLFFSTLTGHFTTAVPEVPSDSCLGGILADEMGLGKTLEVISLIIHRPCPSDITTAPLYDLKLEADLEGVFAFDAGTVVELEMYEDEEDTDATVAMVEESVFCVCGGVGDGNRDLTLISCSVCNSSNLQHEECVQFRRRIDTSAGESLWLKYICPLCWNHLRVHSKATLVVSPDHIWRQWQDELQKHVDLSHLKVLIYEGLNSPPIRLSTSTPSQQQSSFELDPDFVFTPNFVQPGELASADVVLTTYTVLQRELGWASVSAEQRVGEGHRPTLRTAQRYLAPPSPLACVIWWRICLDEAQMAENVTSKIARMLSEVEAVHRWCVTGTPAEKSLFDFYGLLAYLRLEPFACRHYWNALLYQPFVHALRSSSSSTNLSDTLFVRLLSRLLWRNTKSLVGSQLRLPTIYQQIHWVDFTSVERYIHDRTLSDCADALQQMLAEAPDFDLDAPLAALPGNLHWRLVAMVTRARQACTHASLVVIHSSTGGGGGGGRCTGFRASSDPTLQVSKNAKFQGTGCANMTEVIRKVVDEVHQECETSYRTWVFNKNGAAACFILQQKYLEAAMCYREVLRTAIGLESRYGVLSDWSQRLHSITNLHWLIQCHGVPLEKSSSCVEKKTKKIEEEEEGEMVGTSVDGCENSNELPTWGKLDPRVDRDLVWKARLLRIDYLKTHSRLLSKAREKLDPIVSRVEKLLDRPPDFPSSIEGSLTHPWLTWLHEGLEILASSNILDQLPLMVESSLQGRCSQFRTTLLHTRSGAGFKAVLLVEVKSALDARQRLREAMAPLDQTWNCFLKNGEVDRSVLQRYYICCCTRDTTNQNVKSPRKRTKKSTESKCAYCLASEALQAYRQVLNQEKPATSARAQKRAILEGLLEDSVVEDDTALLSGDLTAVGLVNPLTVALQTVATQVSRLQDERNWIKLMAARLDTLIQLLFRELLCHGRVQMLTKEWWNVHDETEQFVVRLQATSPTDMAFIKPEEVESQLHQHSVDALANWTTLQGRLSHLAFLRNALQQHHTASSTLECPTCLQAQSPSRPTFVLLAGCWHSLCLPCHQQIQAHSVSSQRRCPLCRKPFETATSNATKRRPLTLLHFDGGGRKLQSKQEEEEEAKNEIPIKGDHSSKIQEVIRCLKRIKLEDAGAKAVVFSSWISVLLTIGRALEQNGIVCTSLLKPRDGGLAQFRSAESRVWVLLLPLQLGANGLNLIEANHLLLVDPVLSHGREVQAIARLHRIGQMRTCTVHRFLVRNSIETALHGISSAMATAQRNSADCIRRGTGEDRAEILQMSVSQLLDILKTDFAVSA